MAAHEKPWTDADENKLRFLWERGDSTRAIGAEMGRGQSSIAKKSKRLGLAARGSPIRKLAPGDAPKEERKRREVREPLPASVRTLPLLPSERLALGVE